MDLEDLSLSDFEALRLRLDVIRNAAQLLRQNGEVPRICIAPGKPATITLAPLLGTLKPSLQSIIHEWEGKRFAPGAVVHHGADFGAPFDPAPEAMHGAPAKPTPYISPSVAPEPHPIFSLSDAQAAISAADHPGHCVDLQPEAVSGPASSADLAPQPLARPDAWRDDEVAKAIELGVSAVRAGQSVWSAADDLAQATGRTLAACQKRMKMVRGEVEAILAASDLPVVPPVESVTETTIQAADALAAEDPAPSAADVVKAMIAEVAAEAAGRPQLDLPMDDLARHLNQHLATDGWTLAQDTELFELAESAWPMHEIALQIQKPADAVKKRFELLTDKKNQKFRRADVLARIQRMQPPEQA